MGLPHPTRRKKEGTNLGRKHLEELSERRRVFAQKSDGGSRRRGSPSARNTKPARSRLEKLTFGAFSVRTAAVNGVNGIGHIHTQLKTCAATVCDVIGLQETKGDGTSKSSASGCRILF